MTGTTASGDPYTTLFNTLRSLMYYKYCVFETGVQAHVIAAGDDVVIFTNNPQPIAAEIRLQTSPDQDTDSPLGVVVKEIMVTDVVNMSFCSKWFFGTSQGLVATRDVDKLLRTKQYYNKSNANLIADPTLHRIAILQGVRSEQLSHLVEAVLEATVQNYSLNEA